MSIVIALVTDDNRLLFCADRQITEGRTGRRAAQKKIFIRRTPDALSSYGGHLESQPILFGVVGTPALLSSIKYNLELSPTHLLPDKECSEEAYDAYIIGEIVPEIARLERGRRGEWGLECQDFEIMIGFGGYVWSVDSEFTAVRFDEGYDSIGSASNMALAALDTLFTYMIELDESALRNVVEICSHRDITCGEGVDLLELK